MLCLMPPKMQFALFIKNVIKNLTKIQKDYIHHLPFNHQMCDFIIGDQITEAGLFLNEPMLNKPDNSFIL